MANLNTIARSTRLGTMEGPIAPANLTPDQYARGATLMKSSLGISEPPSIQNAQLSSVAGARRSMATEPKATMYGTLGQRLKALDTVKQTISNYYARTDASKRRLTSYQAETQAEQKKNQDLLLQQSEEQQQRKIQSAAEQQQTAHAAAAAGMAKQKEAAAAREKALKDTQTEMEARTQTLLKNQLAAEAAQQKAIQDKLEADANAANAATKKQRDDYQAKIKKAARDYREAEKKPKRDYWEEYIRDRQKAYMNIMIGADPNAMVVYNPGLAQKIGVGGYTIEIPEMPSGYLPDDPNYKPPGGLPPLEDYLIPYEQNFTLPGDPGRTPLFWQLDPKDRPGYLNAWMDDQMARGNDYGGQAREEYLQSIGFTLDPNKPLIKTPAPGWQPQAAAPKPVDPRTQPTLPGIDQPGPLAGPGAPANAQPVPNTFAGARALYLQNNPDVARAGVDPWEHWLTFGQKEGRTWAGPGGGVEPPAGGGGGSQPLGYVFARERYLQDNPDVARAGMDPWRHYTVYGRGEGRIWPGEEEPPITVVGQDG